MISLSKLLADVDSYGDSLRYSRQSKKARSGTRTDRGPVIVWNSTKACNLTCRHCYASADAEPDANELTTEEGFELIDQLEDLNVPVLLLSGGEPLMRPDLFELIAYAREKGIRVTLSTNGTLIDQKVARKLKNLGVSYVGISLDGLEETNDRFRGQKGAFQSALNGIRNCLEIDQKVGLRFTITQANYQDIPGIFELLEKEKIPRICFYHLVASGRGERLGSTPIPLKKKRKIIDDLIERTDELLSKGGGQEILTVANHTDGIYLYYKLRQEGDPRAEQVLKYIGLNQGNRSGQAIGCVDWLGNVHPDQFSFNHNLGNIRDESLVDIWRDNPAELLVKLRNRGEHITGRCSECSWFENCSGNFRARAEAVLADYWASDPGCYLTDKEISSRGDDINEN
ncbi:MAG: radical SAM protein [Halanaerobiaceae bacterium]